MRCALRCGPPDRLLCPGPGSRSAASLNIVEFDAERRFGSDRPASPLVLMRPRRSLGGSSLPRFVGQARTVAGIASPYGARKGCSRGERPMDDGLLESSCRRPMRCGPVTRVFCPGDRAWGGKPSDNSRSGVSSMIEMRFGSDRTRSLMRPRPS